MTHFKIKIIQHNEIFEKSVYKTSVNKTFVVIMAIACKLEKMVESFFKERHAWA